MIAAVLFAIPVVLFLSALTVAKAIQFMGKAIDRVADLLEDPDGSGLTAALMEALRRIPVVEAERKLTGT